LTLNISAMSAATSMLDLESFFSYIADLRYALQLMWKRLLQDPINKANVNFRKRLSSYVDVAGWNVSNTYCDRYSHMGINNIKIVNCDIAETGAIPSLVLCCTAGFLTSFICLHPSLSSAARFSATLPPSFAKSCSI